VESNNRGASVRNDLDRCAFGCVTRAVLARSHLLFTANRWASLA